MIKQSPEGGARYLLPNGDTGVGPDRELTTGTPLWVKVFGIVALVVVVLFVILMFTRGPGGRGPGGHTPFRHFGGQAPSEGGRL